VTLAELLQAHQRLDLHPRQMGGSGALCPRIRPVDDLTLKFHANERMLVPHGRKVSRFRLSSIIHLPTVSMRHLFPAMLARYATAILAVTIAALTTAALWRWLEPTPSLLFFPAVMVVASFAGGGPGALATTLSVFVLAYCFMPPYLSIKIGAADLIRLSTFAGAAGLTTVIANRRRRAEQEARDLSDAFERRVIDRTQELNDTNRVLEAESLERSRLAREVLATQEKERRRLASQLHHGLGEQLSQMERTLSAFPAGADDWRARAATVRQQLAVLKLQVRNLSLDLRPPILDERGLVAALQWQNDRHYAQTTQQISLRYSATVGRFDEAIESTAFRIVQELLSVVATGRRTDGTAVTLHVEDDGAFVLTVDLPMESFLEAAGVTRSVRERAELVGGRLLLEQLPSDAARISVRIPIGRSD